MVTTVLEIIQPQQVQALVLEADHPAAVAEAVQAQEQAVVQAQEQAVVQAQADLVQVQAQVLEVDLEEDQDQDWYIHPHKLEQ